MAVEFQDNSVRVKAEMNSAVIAFLHEAGLTLQRQAANNTRVSSGDTAAAWDYVVDEGALEAVIGNPMQNAIWEEFGTGEYALKKNGRKGYWVYVKGNDGTSSRSQNQYTLQEAKEVAAYLRSQGLDAHYTNGKKPSRAFHNAYIAKKDAIIRQAEKVLKARFKE